MFAKTTHVGFAQRVVATLAACAMMLWSLGAYHIAQAANLTDISDTLSTSEPSVTSSHTIAFTIPTGSTLVNTDTITITWDSQDDGAGGQDFGSINTVLVGDLTVTVAGGGDTATGFSATANSISFDGIDASAGQEVIVVVADGKITNPAQIDSYEIEVDTGTGGDVGRTRVAIVDTVLVTAIVDTVFDFTITGLATSTSINGTTTTGSTSPNTIPFGTLVAGEIKTLAQRLNVTTNARNGYVVTVETDQQLLSSTGADIDSFADGGDDDTPAVWAQPSNSLLDENTWGHWGVTTEDGDLKGAGTAFTVADTWIAASTSPRAIMAHDGPSDGSTQTADATGDDVGQTDVGYQIQITPLQEAADDYNATLTYIATPTF